jgi:hypothetical protein
MKRDPKADLTDGLIAHWPLANHLRENVSGRELGQAKGSIDQQSNGPSIGFGGSGTWLEIPAEMAPKLGTGDFSISVWVQSDEGAEVLSGDLISQYDPETHRGFHVTLKSSPGATTNHANWVHLQFGINDGRFANWRDCGRPGEAILAFALAEHEGFLFAGTCESGRVYRYAGGQDWIDCGAPDGSNSVTSLAVYENALYAGTGKYRLAGSSLPASHRSRNERHTQWPSRRCASLSPAAGFKGNRGPRRETARELRRGPTHGRYARHPSGLLGSMVVHC